MSSSPASLQPTTDQRIVNIAAYKFVELNELQPMRDELKQRCKALGLRGTILLSPEGINLFLAGSRTAIDDFLHHLRSQTAFSDLQVKESYSDQQPFNRMLVKLKREIIAFGVEGIEPARYSSARLSAQELKRWLDEGRPVRLLDTRNDYEVDLGTFRGAERLNLQHFRDFPSALSALPADVRQQPVVAFCTGGIRCEKAGPMLEKLGFQQVYQLEGGILKYFEECGGAHYDGGCFVFDNRVVLGPDLKPTGAVQCFNCQAVLNHEDIQSPKFVFGKSCPHCYQTSEQQREAKRQARENSLRELAESQPGCRPYANQRRIHCAARFAHWKLIDFLCAYQPRIERDQWLAWIADGTITTAGQRVSPEDIVREGQRWDQVQADFVEPPIPTDIRVVYEDEALVVIDKPAGLPVHPGGRFNRNTLESFLAEVYRPEKLRMAHRLDAGTSGLIVLTRKYCFARQLQPQFTSGQVSKTYVLKVHGVPTSAHFQCDAAILDEVQVEGKRRIDPAGAPARTQFQVVSPNSTEGASDIALAQETSTLLLAYPQTGRTHQIRLHASHLGLPIVGDTLYGREDAMGPLCLHAWRLEFAHPATGQPVRFESRLPAWASSLADQLPAQNA